VFRHLRTELDIEITRQPRTLPYVPTQDEIRRYYQTVWQARRTGDVVLIKTLLYTGVRVAELVALRLDDVDLDANRIRVNLALHMDAMRHRGAVHLSGKSPTAPLAGQRVPPVGRLEFRCGAARFAGYRVDEVGGRGEVGDHPCRVLIVDTHRCSPALPWWS